jgi:hypothetical protein
MERFLNRHKSRIVGSISGFDRMRFTGTLRWMAHVDGMGKFLNSQGVLLKHFGPYVEQLSDKIKQRASSIAQTHGRPVQYVASSSESKEDLALQIAQRDGIQEGLIGVLTCVEPCQSFAIEKNKKQKQLRLVSRWRKCLHLYFYWLDRDYGLMHLRLQTWAPFTIQVCINGREWLARQLDKHGIGYEKHDNCFTRIDDLDTAQQFFHRLDQQSWAGWLHRLAVRIHPFLSSKSALLFKPYYWSLSQSEYATDILFRDPSGLQQIYPSLLQHAIHHFHSQDVLRFLGRRIQNRFEGEIRSHMGSRVEGVRIKHWVEENSIKMYDKAGSVLRIETTINNTTRFKVRRRVTRRSQKTLAWVKMRKGVVDIRRRVEVCQGANARYLDALAVVADSTPSHRVLDPVCQPVLRHNRRFRPLRPTNPDDSRLFQQILSGQHLLQGIRNSDLRRAIFPEHEQDPAQRRRASGRITRSLQLLRSHALLYRVPKTNYYRITKKGHIVMATALQFRITDMALFAAGKTVQKN